MPLTRTALALAFCCLTGCHATRPARSPHALDPPPASVDAAARVAEATSPAAARRDLPTGLAEATPPFGVMPRAVPSPDSLATQPAAIRRVALIQESASLPQPSTARPDEGGLPVPNSDPPQATVPGPIAPPHVAESIGGLGLNDLEQLALNNNPSLIEADARIQAARGRWVQVGLPPNTVLGYSGQQVGSHGQAEQQGVYIGQEFIRGGKLRLNRAVVAQEIVRAEQEWAAQQQRVLTDVRLGYYEVLVAQRRIEIARQLVEIAENGVRSAKALLNAMEVSQVDVLRAQIEVQSTQLALQKAQNGLVAAWGRLSAVLGVPEMPLQPLQDPLQVADTTVDADTVLARILSQSPEVAAAIAEIDRARWAVERAHVEPIPNIDVQGVVQSDNGTGSTNGNLQVTMPIPWLDRNQGGIQEVHAELVAAQLALERLELDLKQRLASVFQRYANARNQVDAYIGSDGILERARRTLELIQQGYEAGEFSYVDLLNAQQTYFQTQLGYVDALGDLWAAVAEIDGLLLTGSLGSNP